MPSRARRPASLQAEQPRETEKHGGPQPDPLRQTSAEWLRLAAQPIAELDRGISAQRIAPGVSVSEVRRHLEQLYGEFSAPIPAEALVEDTARMLRDWNLHITHPRYFGLFNPSVVPPSVAADALVAAFNPQLAAWSHAPAANEIERFVLAFFARRLGLPASTHGHFTSGGAEANHSALLAAMASRLSGHQESGVFGADARPMIYASSESHHSFDKIVRAVGLGRRSLQLVEVCDDLTLSVADLEKRLRSDRDAGRHPFLVAATAGTTGAGVVDSLREIAAVCRTWGMWFHVDAAWGGAACLSPRLRGLLDGIDAADSITWDAHKYLSVPMGAGMFFCRDPAAIPAAFAARTPYMPQPTDDTFDPYSSSMQWSRRHIGLKVFVALAALGEAGYATLIEHQAAMGTLLRTRLQDAGFVLKNRTALPVVCFSHPRIEQGEVALASVIAALAAENFWISSVRLAQTRHVLRACVTSYQTQEDDVEALVEALCRSVQ